MATGVPWARVVFVGSSGAVLATAEISGPGAPDLAAVDALARALLAGRRLGCAVRVDDVSHDLRRLLDLVGLCRQMEGQPEGGEEVLGVEEGVEPDDPVA